MFYNTDIHCHLVVDSYYVYLFYSTNNIIIQGKKSSVAPKSYMKSKRSLFMNCPAG